MNVQNGATSTAANGGALDFDSLAEFILETSASGVESIDASSPLFSSGIIDSMGVIQLVEYIEDRTGRKVKPTDITLENFDTVDSILAYLQD